MFCVFNQAYGFMGLESVMIEKRRTAARTAESSYLSVQAGGKGRTLGMAPIFGELKARSGTPNPFQTP